jgi:hypothetical protein
MVAIKTLLISTALLTSGALARIKSMYVDKDTVQAGQNVTVTLRNLGYIQNWDDFSVRLCPAPSVLLLSPLSILCILWPGTDRLGHLGIEVTRHHW